MKATQRKAKIASARKSYRAYHRILAKGPPANFHTIVGLAEHASACYRAALVGIKRPAQSVLAEAERARESAINARRVLLPSERA